MWRHSLQGAVTDKLQILALLWFIIHKKLYSAMLCIFYKLIKFC